MLTLVFGTAMNPYKMASNEEVLYIKKLGIVDVNNFVVRAIVIQFHLKGRNYVEAVRPWHSKYYSAN